MARQEETFQCIHPEPSKSAPRISMAKYEAVRRAILEAVSRNVDGILFKDLDGEVAKLLPRDVLNTIGSVGWYTITVKLDLEARGLIERIPGSRPQRIRMKG